MDSRRCKVPSRYPLVLGCAKNKRMVGVDSIRRLQLAAGPSCSYYSYGLDHTRDVCARESSGTDRLTRSTARAAQFPAA